MKYNKYLWLALMMLAIFSCHESSQVQINGTTGDTVTTHIYIEKFDAGNSKFLDSIQVKKNGNFHYKFTADKPEFYLLKTKNQQCILVLKPTDKIHINFNATNKFGYRIDGSDECNDVQTINYAWQHTKTQLKDIQKHFVATQDETEQLELSKQYDSLIKVQRRTNIKYIIEHPTSLVSLLALFQKISPEEYLHNRFIDLQYYKILNDSLAPLYPKMGFIKSLQQNFTKFHQQYQTQKLVSSAKNINIGIPDLEIRDLNNHIVKLSAIDAKVVLLNFWSANHKTSISLNEKLKGFYRQYKDKGFEVMSINIDPDTTTWKNAVKFSEYNWIDVHERSTEGSYAASVYNVSDLPDYYLIDMRKMDILGRELSIPELKRKIEYHLK
ncbi:thioredoxin-like domain-containing protein [Bacteroidales bacterium]|nr:thioredoxin-like domain-containing protein [Bacteroidales bacterium]